MKKSMDDLPRAYRLQRWAGEVKAVAQMIVGVVMVTCVCVRLYKDRHLDLHFLQSGVFDVIGVGLAVAAAFELSYTFFTHGPDEAVDPALLAVSAALIIQLGADVDGLTWTDALTTCLLVAALAGLFAVRSLWVMRHSAREDARSGHSGPDN